MAMTVTYVAVVSVFTTGMLRRLLILFGLMISTLLYGLFVNGLGWGVGGDSGVQLIDFSKVKGGRMVWLTSLFHSIVDTAAMLIIVPVAVILVAENLGHLRAVQAMTGRDMDSKIGMAFMGDGFATMLSGAMGGTGVTTYAETLVSWLSLKFTPLWLLCLRVCLPFCLGFHPRWGL